MFLLVSDTFVSAQCLSVIGLLMICLALIAAGAYVFVPVFSKDQRVAMIVAIMSLVSGEYLKQVTFTFCAYYSGGSRDAPQRNLNSFAGGQTPLPSAYDLVCLVLHLYMVKLGCQCFQSPVHGVNLESLTQCHPIETLNTNGTNVRKQYFHLAYITFKKPKPGSPTNTLHFKYSMGNNLCFHKIT